MQKQHSKKTLAGTQEKNKLSGRESLDGEVEDSGGDHPVRMLLRCQPCVAYYHLLLYCRWPAIKEVQRGRKES